MPKKPLSLPPHIVGRAIVDPTFRKELLEAPEDTLIREGIYNPPAEVVQALKDLGSKPEHVNALMEHLSSGEGGSPG